MDESFKPASTISRNYSWQKMLSVSMLVKSLLRVASKILALECYTVNSRVNKVYWLIDWRVCAEFFAPRWWQCVCSLWYLFLLVPSGTAILKLSVSRLVQENSRHFATPPLVSLDYEVRETSAETPYWWLVTTQIWVVLLIGWTKYPTWNNQSKALPRPG